MLIARTVSTKLKTPRVSTVDRFIIHGAASTSLNGVVAMMVTGSRTVSSNFVIGRGGEIVQVVEPSMRAWTSGSATDGGKGAAFDHRAITVECINSGGEKAGWPFSDATVDALAQLIAWWSTEYDTEITDDTVLTHQELWGRFRASYATACPQSLQPRKPEILALARAYATPTEEEDDMKPTLHLRTSGGAEASLVAPWYGLDLKPGQSRKAGTVTTKRGVKITTDPATILAWQRVYAKGSGTATSQTDRAAYIAIQGDAEAQSLEWEIAERTLRGAA